MKPIRLFNPECKNVGIQGLLKLDRTYPIYVYVRSKEEEDYLKGLALINGFTINVVNFGRITLGGCKALRSGMSTNTLTTIDFMWYLENRTEDESQGWLTKLLNWLKV